MLFVLWRTLPAEILNFFVLKKNVVEQEEPVDNPTIGTRFPYCMVSDSKAT